MNFRDVTEGEQQHEPEEERSSNEQNGDGGDKLAKLIKIHSKINKSPNDLILILLDLSCDPLHFKNMNTHARVFKCILNYILIQQNMTQSLLDSFLNLHFKIVTFTLEKCLFSAFLNVFFTYCLKIEKPLKMGIHKMGIHKMAKTTFSSFFFV